MQKWELMKVGVASPESLEEIFPNDLILRVRALNDKTILNWETGQDAFEYFQTIGEQGWELVTVESSLNLYGSAFWYFKRPKP